MTALATRTFIGLDVHQGSIYACALDRETGERRDGRFRPADRPELLAWLLGLPQPCEAACEVGNGSFVLARFLMDGGVPCVVVEHGAGRGERRHKTDARDALALARLLSSGQVEGVFIPSAKQQARRSMSHRRADLVQRKGDTQRKIRAYIADNSLSEEAGCITWSKRGIERLRTLGIAETCGKLVFETLVDEWVELDGSIRRIDASMKREVSRDPLMAKLTALDGVGPIAAYVSVSEACEFSRFPTADEYVSYVGLAPVARNSGTLKAQRSGIGHSHTAACFKSGAASLFNSHSGPLIASPASAAERGVNAIRFKVRETLERGMKPRLRNAVIARTIAEEAWRLGNAD